MDDKENQEITIGLESVDLSGLCKLTSRYTMDPIYKAKHKAYMMKKVPCKECGSMQMRCNMTKHRKTKKHKEIIEKMNNAVKSHEHEQKEIIEKMTNDVKREHKEIIEKMDHLIKSHEHDVIDNYVKRIFTEAIKSLITNV